MFSVEPTEEKRERVPLNWEHMANRGATCWRLNFFSSSLISLDWIGFAAFRAPRAPDFLGLEKG